MKRLLWLLLLMAGTAYSQTIETGRFINGPAAARPTCSASFNAATANSGDIYNDTDDANVFKCSGGTWATFGGGGATPSGNAGVIQKNSYPSAGALAASGITDTGSLISSSEDFSFNGPNPYVDIRAYGARGAPLNNIPTTTATISATSTSATLASASTFQNGDGVLIYGAGSTCSLTTPGAPSVTSFIAGAGTGTQIGYAAPTGSTSYAYEIVARGPNGCRTAASSTGSTSNGVASLGLQTISITSLSKSNATVTVTTATAHGLSQFAMVAIYNTSNSPDFGGWYQVASVVDATHFTYTSVTDTREGSATSATGGTIYYWAYNKITWSGQTGDWQYYIYGPSCPGTCNLIGVSFPNPNYEFDDYGSTMEAGQTFPPDVPTTPQGSATSNHLSTTIVSGAGTTTLTLANAASTSVTSNKIVYDDAPGIRAALAVNSNIYIPLRNFAFGSTVTQSPITLPSGSSIQQAGSWTVNEPVTLPQYGAQWKGNWTTIALGAPLTVGTTNVGIYCSVAGCFNADVRNLQIGWASTNAKVGIYGESSDQFILQDVIFNVGNGSPYDYLGFGMFVHNTFFHCYFKHLGFSAGTPQTIPQPPTPVFNCANCGQNNFDDLYFITRGMQTNSSAFDIRNLYIQGGIMPLVIASLYSTGGAGRISDVVLDTTSAPVILNLGNVYNNFQLDNIYIGPSADSGGIIPAFTGVTPLKWSISGNGQPYYAVAPTGSDSVTSGQQADGSFQTLPQTSGVLRQLAQHVQIGGGYSLFTMPTPPIFGTPTCTVNTAGPPYTPAGTNVSYQYIAVYPNGGFSKPSPACTATTDGATQQLTLTVPTAIPGAASYAWYHGGAGINTTSPTTSLSYVYLSAVGGSPAQINGGGPSGMRADLAWTGTLALAPSASAPAAFAGVKFFYLSSDNWPAFNVNSSSTKYFMAGVSGSWVQGQCAVATATANVFGLQICGGTSTFTGITSGTNTTATMTVGSGATLTYSGSGITNARQVIGIDFAGASGCGSTTYLRGDGTCNTPAGAGNVSTTTGAQYGIATYTNSTTIGTVAPSTSGYPLISQGASAYPVFGQLPSAGLNITTTSCTNQAITAISSAAAGTCTSITPSYATGSTSGSGNFCLTTSCVMTTPNLGTPSAINLTNATSPPIWNQNTTGNAATATALAANPTTCSAGQAAIGVLASGNATGCFTPSGVGLQTNGTNNASQATLNFITSTTNATGLTVTPSNSTSTEKFEATGTVNTTSGGTGVSAPTAHTVPVAEGATAMTFISPSTAGYVMTSNGTGADPSFQILPGNAVNTCTTYGSAYYASSSTITCITPPTANGVYNVVYNVAGGVALAPSVALAGLSGRAVTGSASTDTVAYSDNLTVVDHDSAGSASVNETLPTASTLGNANFAYSYSNHSTHTDTITPTTWTINGSATLSVPAGNYCRVKVNPNSSTDWLADCAVSAFTGVSTISGDGALITNSNSAGTVTLVVGSTTANKFWGGTGGSGSTPSFVQPAFSNLSGSATCAQLPALTGDTTSSAGTCATTTTKINGTAFSGTTNDVVGFGASNVPLDTGVLYTNLVTASSNFSGNLVTGTNGAKTSSDSGIAPATVVTCAAAGTSGDLLQFAGANRTCSDSSIATANVVTNSTGNAAAANQIIVASAASKAVKAIDFPDVKIIPAASCSNTTAGAAWSVNSTFTATCRAGTNNLTGVLNGTPSAGTAIGYFDFELPGDWDSGTKPYIAVYYASGSNTSGTVIWTISTACTKNDGSITDDPSWIAESAMGTQTMAAANRMWSQNAQLAGAMTNCVAGGTMYVKLALTGTASSAIQVSKATITVPRLLVVQAN